MGTSMTAAWSAAAVLACVRLPSPQWNSYLHHVWCTVKFIKCGWCWKQYTAPAGLCRTQAWFGCILQGHCLSGGVHIMPFVFVTLKSCPLKHPGIA
jgi:hypothetical protein